MYQITAGGWRETLTFEAGTAQGAYEKAQWLIQERIGGIVVTAPDGRQYTQSELPDLLNEQDRTRK